ncbi:MAG TPA: LecA/PA-IL family lectin [Pyrinomonadaceae bacterium]
MSTFGTFYRSIAAAGLMAVLAVSVAADTIRLKDGSIIKGRITTFSDGRFVVVIGEGERRREMSFAAADIESVTFDNGVVRRPTVTNAANMQKMPPKVVVEDRPPAMVRDEVVLSEPDSTTSNSNTRDRGMTRSTSSAKQIEVSIKVLADNTSNGWTNSGWVVRKGQKIRITGSGEINLGRGNKTSASGSYDLEDQTKLLKAVPTGALIAVIGDDNNDFIYIGTSREFVAERDGALFLGVNEGNLNDNSGNFDVKIEIDPES